MVRFTLSDRENALILKEGVVPPVEELLTRFPMTVERVGNLDRDSDATTARIVATYAQAIAGRRGFDSNVVAAMETWVISPSSCEESGLLREWFSAMDNRYRVFIHRSPMLDASSLSPVLTYDHAHSRLGIRSRSGPYSHLKPQAMKLLIEMREAYRGTHEDRLSVMERIGHPFGCSYN